MMTNLTRSTFQAHPYHLVLASLNSLFIWSIKHIGLFPSILQLIFFVLAPALIQIIGINGYQLLDNLEIVSHLAWSFDDLVEEFDRATRNMPNLTDIMNPISPEGNNQGSANFGSGGNNNPEGGGNNNHYPNPHNGRDNDSAGNSGSENYNFSGQATSSSSQHQQTEYQMRRALTMLARNQMQYISRRRPNRYNLLPKNTYLSRSLPINCTISSKAHQFEIARRVRVANLHYDNPKGFRIVYDGYIPRIIQGVKDKTANMSPEFLRIIEEYENVER